MVSAHASPFAKGVQFKAQIPFSCYVYCFHPIKEVEFHKQVAVELTITAKYLTFAEGELQGKAKFSSALEI